MKVNLHNLPIRVCRVLPVFLFILAGCVNDPVVAQTSIQDAQSLRTVFEKANALYGEGDFEGAIEKYTSLVERGIENEVLYYNIGNAYYKNGELGKAVLFYERALRLSPRDKDARENLSLIESMLRDRQFIRKENRFKRALVWMNRNFSTREAVVLASAFYFLFCLLVVIYIFRNINFVAALYKRLSILSPGRFLGLSREQDLLLITVIIFMLLVGSSASAYHKVTVEKQRDRSVVIEQEAAVYSGPTNDSTLQFKIHEGTRVRVRMRRHGWVQIDLPGDLSGWVRDNTVEEI